MTKTTLLRTNTIAFTKSIISWQFNFIPIYCQKILISLLMGKFFISLKTIEVGRIISNTSILKPWYCHTENKDLLFIIGFYVTSLALTYKAIKLHYMFADIDMTLTQGRLKLFIRSIFLFNRAFLMLWGW